MMTKFPKRDNGRGLTHYGIQFAFANTADLQIFVGKLQAALTLTTPIAPERTLDGEIREVETEATALRKARIGQGRFRADLLNFWQGHCAITEVYIPELLRASHIKPWHASTDLERLDAFNGLLLAVHLDALFDCALITFQDSGQMQVSKRLSMKEREVFV
jgi:putative restriction endonuclease